jgi:hypothetical protein
VEKKIPREHSKEATVAILILDRADFKSRKVIGYTKRHYVMIKGSILQEDITLLSTLVLNYRSN